MASPMVAAPRSLTAKGTQLTPTGQGPAHEDRLQVVPASSIAADRSPARLTPATTTSSPPAPATLTSPPREQFRNGLQAGPVPAVRYDPVTASLLRGLDHAVWGSTAVWVPLPSGHYRCVGNTPSGLHCHLGNTAVWATPLSSASPRLGSTAVWVPRRLGRILPAESTANLSLTNVGSPAQSTSHLRRTVARSSFPPLSHSQWDGAQPSLFSGCAPVIP